MILYQPQNLKPYFARTLIKVFTAIIATIKATMFPIMKTKIFSVEAKIISYPFWAFGVPSPQVLINTE